MGVLTAKLIHDLLDYDPVSGEFTWKPRPGEDAKARTWNTRYAEKPAGVRTHGYIKIAILNRRYYAHRLAWLYMTGSWPADLLDHRDKNGENNSWINLREATKALNATNLRQQRSNRTGYTGVVELTPGRFMAQCKRKGRPAYIGTYSTAEAAHEAYLQVRDSVRPRWPE